MENSDVFVNGDNQVNEEKPPPRACPRCNSDNTKFCYYNNYSVSQPRYFCKNCRRYWTHGGALRNIPVGGSGRKSKRATKVDQPSVSQVSQVLSVEVNHHQPFFNVRENSEFLGSFGGSSSSATVVMNPLGSLSSVHGGIIPIQSFPPMDHSNFVDGSFQQGYFDVGSNDLIGNSLVNQSLVENVDNHNNFCMNQEDQNKWNQSFNSTMNMNHNASTSGSGGYFCK